jgi:hypothetical protein
VVIVTKTAQATACAQFAYTQSWRGKIFHSERENGTVARYASHRPLRILLLIPLPPRQKKTLVEKYRTHVRIFPPYELRFSGRPDYIRLHATSPSRCQKVSVFFDQSRPNQKQIYGHI